MASLSPTLLKYSQGIYKIERWTIFGILRSWNEKRYVGHMYICETRTQINRRFSVENLLKTWICLFFFCATASKCWNKFNYTSSVSRSTWKSIFDNIDLKIFENYWHIAIVSFPQSTPQISCARRAKLWPDIETFLIQLLHFQS